MPVRSRTLDSENQQTVQHCGNRSGAFDDWDACATNHGFESTHTWTYSNRYVIGRHFQCEFTRGRHARLRKYQSLNSEGLIPRATSWHVTRMIYSRMNEPLSYRHRQVGWALLVSLLLPVPILWFTSRLSGSLLPLGVGIPMVVVSVALLGSLTVEVDRTTLRCRPARRAQCDAHPSR